jgi:hypothetical protein
MAAALKPDLSPPVHEVNFRGVSSEAHDRIAAALWAPIAALAAPPRSGDDARVAFPNNATLTPRQVSTLIVGRSHRKLTSLIRLTVAIGARPLEPRTARASGLHDAGATGACSTSFG